MSRRLNHEDFHDTIPAYEPRVRRERAEPRRVATYRAALWPWLAAAVISLLLSVQW